MGSANLYAAPTARRLTGLEVPRFITSSQQGFRLAVSALFLLAVATTPSSATELTAEQTIQSLRAELAEAQEARAALEKQLEHARGEIAKSLEDLFASATWKSDPEVVVLRGKLDSAVKEIALLTTAAEGAKSDAAAAQDALAAANSKIEKLTSEKERALAEASEAKAGLAADATQRADLETKLAKARTAAADAEGLRSALRQARLEADGLKSNLAALGQERDSLTAELEAVKGEVAKRVEQVFAQATKSAKQETEALQAKLDASKAEATKLQDKSRAADKERNQLKAELAALLEAKTKAEHKAVAIETARKRAVKRVEELNQVQKDLRLLLKTAGEETKATRSELAELSAFRQEAADAKQLVLTLTSENKALQGERDSLAREIEQSKSQVASAQAKADSAAKVAARAVRASANEAESLRDQLSASKRELEQVKAELASAQARIRNASDDNYKRIEELIVAAAAGPGTELTDLKAKLAMAEEEIERLSQALNKQGANGTAQ